MSEEDYDHGGAMMEAEAQAAFEATEPDPPDWVLEREEVAVSPSPPPRAGRINTLYISGPMTGHPDLNYPTFRKVAHMLRTVGFTVLSPAELGCGPEVPWEVCIRRAIRQMLEAEGVATLPGWQQSKGARLEVELADRVGLPVMGWGVWRGYRLTGAR